MCARSFKSLCACRAVQATQRVIFPRACISWAMLSLSSVTCAMGGMAGMPNNTIQMPHGTQTLRFNLEPPHTHITKTTQFATVDGRKFAKAKKRPPCLHHEICNVWAIHMFQPLAPKFNVGACPRKLALRNFFFSHALPSRVLSPLQH